MKLTSIALIATAFGITACMQDAPPASTQTQTAVQANGFTPITERAEFVSLIEGKKFRGDGNWWTISGDGQMFGNFKKGRLEGTWEWRDGAWCRTYELAGKTKEENCQNIAVKGKQVMFIKDRAEGAQSIETLSR